MSPDKLLLALALKLRATALLSLAISGTVLEMLLGDRGAITGRPAQCVLGLLLPILFGVIGANMGRKLFVALRLEVAHHFIEGCAGGHIKRIESPSTLGAAKTPKTLLLNPYQLPAHGRRCRCAPTSTRLLSRDETCQFGISDSFGSGVLPDCSRKPSPSLGVADDS
jgi:hypothetical protein